MDKNNEVHLKFKDLQFEENEGFIRVRFLKIFYFDIKKKDLEKISNFNIKKNSIIFKGISENKAENKFNHLLDIGFDNLKNKVTGNKAIYIHQHSEIPLIGTNYFGLVDRGSNIIELKPITSCNFDCIYCSVDQSRRNVDFVVEKDYIVDEFRKLVEFKGVDEIEAHIGGQGEPLLYADITAMIKDISNIKSVSIISIDTNGSLLSEKLIDDLVDAGLTRINLSINAIDPELAKKIAGFPYDIERIKKIAKYIASKIDLIIAPVMMKGINEEEMPKIIKFAKEIKQKNNVWVGIQNYLYYKFGKKAAKQIEWEDFFDKLKKWEKEFDISLTKMPFKFFKAPQLKLPFKKDDVINAKLICKGRFRNEMLAVANGRVIAIPNCKKKKEKVNVKIFRSKDNIFSGKIV